MYRPMTQQEKDEWDDREEMLPFLRYNFLGGFYNG